MTEQLPDARWGGADTKPADWRKEPADVDPDDEELPKTPVDVVEMLGFDPLDAAAESRPKAKHIHIHLPGDDHR